MSSLRGMSQILNILLRIIPCILYDLILICFFFIMKSNQSSVNDPASLINIKLT